MLLLAASLLSLAIGFVIDNTDNNLDNVIHVLPTALNRDSGFAPLRIHYELGAIRLNPTNQDKLTDTMIPSANSYLSAALSTRTVQDTLVLGASECGGMLVPDYFNFYGFSGADVVIFLTGGESTLVEGSWGTPCVREDGGLD
jgi:hypothetical protein